MFNSAVYNAITLHRWLVCIRRHTLNAGLSICVCMSWMLLATRERIKSEFEWNKFNENICECILFFWALYEKNNNACSQTNSDDWCSSLSALRHECCMLVQTLQIIHDSTKRSSNVDVGTNSIKLLLLMTTTTKATTTTTTTTTSTMGRVPVTHSH